MMTGGPYLYKNMGFAKDVDGYGWLADTHTVNESAKKQLEMLQEKMDALQVQIEERDAALQRCYANAAEVRRLDQKMHAMTPFAMAEQLGLEAAKTDATSLIKQHNQQIAQEEQFHTDRIQQLNKEAEELEKAAQSFQDKSL